MAQQKAAHSRAVELAVLRAVQELTPGLPNECSAREIYAQILPTFPSATPYSVAAMLRYLRRRNFVSARDHQQWHLWQLTKAGREHLRGA